MLRKVMFAFVCPVAVAFLLALSPVARGEQRVERAPAQGGCIHVVSFEAGQVAQVRVVGDGDTDLDLFVYRVLLDANGDVQQEELVARHDDYTDNCVVQFFNARRTSYVVVVKNLGDVYNEYVFTTNGCQIVDTLR